MLEQNHNHNFLEVIMTGQRKEIQYESENDPNFKVASADGAFGFLTPGGGRMAFYVDIPVNETGNIILGESKPPELYTNKIRRVSLIDLRMSPETFKSIAKFMTDQVANYEKMVQAGTPPKIGEAAQSQYQ
jgi:hypothetical protein